MLGKVFETRKKVPSSVFLKSNFSSKKCSSNLGNLSELVEKAVREGFPLKFLEAFKSLFGSRHVRLEVPLESFYLKLPPSSFEIKLWKLFPIKSPREFPLKDSVERRKRRGNAKAFKASVNFPSNGNVNWSFVLTEKFVRIIDAALMLSLLSEVQSPNLIRFWGRLPCTEKFFNYNFAEKRQSQGCKIPQMWNYLKLQAFQGNRMSELFNEAWDTCNLKSWRNTSKQINYLPFTSFLESTSQESLSN